MTQPADAVTLFLPHASGDGRVLSISRGWRRPWDWNLPGGKVEPDETPAEALVREVFEETGILVQQPWPIFQRFVPAGTGSTGRAFTCTAFSAKHVAGTPRWVGREGWVTWVWPHRLEQGTFGEYNTILLACVQLAGGVQNMKSLHPMV